MVVQIGALDRRIVIQRATVLYSDFNEPIPTWSTLTTVWANKRDVSAGEAYKAAEVNAEITTRFTVRWNSITSTISPTDRISYGGKVYNITAVRSIDRNRWLEIDAAARADTVMQSSP